MERVKEYKGEERKGISPEGLWTEQELAVKAGDPLVDSGKGKSLVIRVFDFKFEPRVKQADIQRARNNKQEFFNTHAKYIRDFLWKDGLKIREDHDPKLLFKKDGYRIAILCEARLGVNVFEKPTTLQNIFNRFTKKK